MYRVRNQLLASARFPLDNNCGIRGRNPLDLLEHRFESRAVADHLLEFAPVRPLFATTESLESSHRQPPGARIQSLSAQLSRAARTLSSRTSSSNGLARNSTAPALSACIRIFVSPCAVMKIVGILQCSAFNWACSSKPDIPGIRISAIRQAVSSCWPDFRNSSADANAFEGNPTDFIMPCSALRINSSSSTIATIFFFLSVAILVRYSSKG